MCTSQLGQKPIGNWQLATGNMWLGHNAVVVWAGSNVKHIIFVFTYNKYKMHDAFLIDFHANKQAKRTARMVFRPTPWAPWKTGPKRSVPPTVLLPHCVGT